MAQSLSTESFELFTSLRYDPILIDCPQNDSELLSFSPKSPLYMLIYHRDRMLEAARHFAWQAVVENLLDGKSLEKALLSEIEKYQSRNGGQKTPLKVRKVRVAPDPGK
jgi:4-amino-4-deoxychorismate lyase